MAGPVSNCMSFQNTAKKYLTSTGKSHRFIPNVPQEFDCRVKANIKPESDYKDLTIKDEEFKTVYFQEFPRKIVLPEQWYRPPQFQCMEFSRTVEEKLFKNPPAPIVLPLSQMKDSFRMNYIGPCMEEIKAPTASAKCNVSKLGCEQQPAIPPQRKGHWRWTDPYLSTNKADYIAYDDQVDDKIKSKIITYYNALKFDFPAGSGNKTMFDRCIFKNVLPLRWLARSQKRLPFFGMQSEYQDHYIKQTFSDTYPYLHDSCTEFEDSLAPASRWQNLPSPGMYCSEYCTIGGGSVRRIVDPKIPKKEITRTQNCCRLY